MQYGGDGVDVPNRTMGDNYGLDKLRFLQPVPAGSKVRARAKLVEATEKNPGQYLFKLEVTVDIEGFEKYTALIHFCKKKKNQISTVHFMYDFWWL